MRAELATAAAFAVGSLSLSSATVVGPVLGLVAVAAGTTFAVVCAAGRLGP